MADGTECGDVFISFGFLKSLLVGRRTVSNFEQFGLDVGVSYVLDEELLSGNGVFSLGAHPEPLDADERCGGPITC